MSNIVRASALLALGFCICAANLATADFRVRVDNLSNPSGYTNWGAPDNTVSIQPKYTDGSISVGAAVPASTTLSENHQVTFFGRTYPTQVTWIRIQNTSDDMFGIDQIEVTNAAGTVIQTFGVDNQNAWCCSTDQQDGYTVDCNGNPAQDRWYFYPNGTVV
jgi:hypothetical protein